VQVWDDVTDAVDAGDVAAEFVSRHLDAAARLLFMPDSTLRQVSLDYARPGDRVSFADGFPLLLIGQASLDELNRRLPDPVAMVRFRPNIVVSGATPHAEDGWRRLRVGDVDLDVVKPCARCAVPNVDPETAVAGREPTRTLAGYRRWDGKIWFGQNVLHRSAGVLRVGDPVDRCWRRTVDTAAAVRACSGIPPGVTYLQQDISHDTTTRAPCPAHAPRRTVRRRPADGTAGAGDTGGSGCCAVRRIAAPAAYALQNVTLVDADGRRTEGQTVVVRAGRIEAVGRGIAVPADARVLAGDTLFVYPGIVDALGTVRWEFPRDTTNRAQLRSWDPPRVTMGYMPSRRVVDYLQAAGSDVADQRRRGVVAVAVHPSPTDPLMPGRGTFLLLRRDARTPQHMVLQPELAPLLTFRGGRGVYPSTGMAVVQWYRQLFMDVQRNVQVTQVASTNPGAVIAPTYDADHAVVQEALREGRVFFAANDANEIRRVLTLSEEFGLRPVIVGGTEAWRVAAELRAANVPVIVNLDFATPRRWKPDAAADTTSTERPDPAVERERVQFQEQYANAAKLAEAGVTFALGSGGRGDLRAGVRRAMEYGLSEAAAHSRRHGHARRAVRRRASRPHRARPAGHVHCHRRPAVRQRHAGGVDVRGGRRRAWRGGAAAPRRRRHAHRRRCAGRRHHPGGRHVGRQRNGRHGRPVVHHDAGAGRHHAHRQHGRSRRQHPGDRQH
jgi:hypothetical protein